MNGSRYLLISFLTLPTSVLAASPYIELGINHMSASYQEKGINQITLGSTRNTSNLNLTAGVEFTYTPQWNLSVEYSYTKGMGDMDRYGSDTSYVDRKISGTHFMSIIPGYQTSNTGKVYARIGKGLTSFEAQTSAGYSVRDDLNTFIWGMGYQHRMDNTSAFTLEYLNVNTDDNTTLFSETAFNVSATGLKVGYQHRF